MIALLDKLAAILRRDLLTAIRHRSAFVISFVGVFTELAAFYFLSRAIGPSFRPDGIGYFPYLMAGTGLYTFFVMSAQAFVVAVQDAQQNGTLEVLMSSATAPAELLILSAVSALTGSLMNLLVYVAAGVALFRAAIDANALAVVVVVLLCLAIALAIGVIAATFQIALQKGSALIWLLGSGLWFLSGTMFPVTSLPVPLALLARMNPFAYAIEAMRGALLQGRPIQSMQATLAPLAIFAVILLVVAFSGLSLSMRRARQLGTLSFY